MTDERVQVFGFSGTRCELACPSLSTLLLKRQDVLNELTRLAELHEKKDDPAFRASCIEKDLQAFLCSENGRDMFDGRTPDEVDIEYLRRRMEAQYDKKSEQFPLLTMPLHERLAFLDEQIENQQKGCGGVLKLSALQPELGRRVCVNVCGSPQGAGIATENVSWTTVEAEVIREEAS